eukprot:TRINITY_DN6876_c0_g1_i1.p1 TRINITY_DN6876_c0_g1~~TRINITY_DN6876_c0_g1_i1.p1  ORF type:complete len:133 (-),score=19.38 TRINITY_DN6876_c0_g1_i1:78-476(-)
MQQPSLVFDQPWCYAERKKPHSYPKHTERGGKWLIFDLPSEIDKVWIRVVEVLNQGLLGDMAKASTSYAPEGENRVICVYTYDGENEADVWRVREGLKSIGIFRRLPWKSDQATYEGRYTSSGHTKISKYFG